MDDDSPQSDSSVGEPSADKRAIATAYHEAGHAVLAMVLGRPIHKVTIAPGQLQVGGVRLGACHIKKGRVKASRDWIEDEVLILLAGMVAESHFTGEYCTRGANQDLLAAKRLLQTRASNERQFERLLRRMLDRTEHELADDAHAAAVEQIAAELLARTTISGRSVQHIYEQALRAHDA